MCVCVCVYCVQFRITQTSLGPYNDGKADARVRSRARVAYNKINYRSAVATLRARARPTRSMFFRPQSFHHTYTRARARRPFSFHSQPSPLTGRLVGSLVDPPSNLHARARARYVYVREGDEIIFEKPTETLRDTYRR